jgi:cytochrome c553
MEAIGAPALAGQSDWYLFSKLKDVKSGVRSVPMMRGFTSALDETTMRNLAAYLHSLPSH